MIISGKTATIELSPFALSSIVPPDHWWLQLILDACDLAQRDRLSAVQRDRELFAAQAEEYAQLQAQIDKVDARLMAWHRADECSRRLTKIPGVGPIGAVLLTMKTPEPELFRSGRQFA